MRGVTYPRGFSASGVVSGLKPSGGKDLALIVSDLPSVASGTFTRNAFAAPPVLLSRRRLAGGGLFRGIVANSGNANAGTGRRGECDALAMTEIAASAVGCKADEFLVASTGIIGRPLDMGKVRSGIEAAARALSPDGGAAAAEAIMTTDTAPKSGESGEETEGFGFRIGGIAKGAGMIHPGMATMLAFLTTDISIGREDLDRVFRSAVERSFNRITVDGDTSTNDSAIILANGASGVTAEGEVMEVFERNLGRIMTDLALAMVRDAEGGKRVMEVLVEGAASDAEADLVAEAIAVSPLVKTALAGGDPNWGRILAAVGNSGAEFDPGAVVIEMGGIRLFEKGSAAAVDHRAAAEAFSKAETIVRIEVGDGSGSSRRWTSDLTEEYIRINAEYTT